MAQLIWAHGEGCHCEGCEGTNKRPHYLLIDRFGEDHDKATLPTKGDKAFFIDQYGKRYSMEEDND